MKNVVQFAAVPGKTVPVLLVVGSVTVAVMLVVGTEPVAVPLVELVPLAAEGAASVMDAEVSLKACITGAFAGGAGMVILSASGSAMAITLQILLACWIDRCGDKVKCLLARLQLDRRGMNSCSQESKCNGGERILHCERWYR